ncbi:MAG TPA: glycosyltransferase [Acidimicrobiales bacterium]|nr:glycosyltransferase [Acidimicrobiales bacterium]
MSPTPDPTDSEISGSACGVNVLGTWDSTTGVMEAARRTVAGLLDAGVRVALDYVETGTPKDVRRIPGRFRDLERGRPFEIDICFLNINEMHLLADSYLRDRSRSNYLIGSWYWELPRLSERMVKQAGRVDEIWVGSEFVADAFARYVDVPVTVIPPVVATLPDPGVGRERFGLSQGECVFLYSFDAHSTFARKNPWGIIEAFRDTFNREERGNRVRLMMKALNLGHYSEGASRLRHELAKVNGVLIEEDLTSGETAALINCCDIYVSLHRAEGFGLGMAEAMFLGKPVIATNYSGCRDFASSTTSFPVSYILRQIEIGELRYNAGVEELYTPGFLWADPSINDAAFWMRYLYENPAVRRASGLRGQREICGSYSSNMAGSAMKRRLTEISTNAHCGS